MVTVPGAAALIGRSLQAVNEAIPRLVEAGMLEQTTVGRRNRAFEAPELIDSFPALERQLASQEGTPRRHLRRDRYLAAPRLVARRPAGPPRPYGCHDDETGTPK